MIAFISKIKLILLPSYSSRYRVSDSYVDEKISEILSAEKNYSDNIINSTEYFKPSIINHKLKIELITVEESICDIRVTFLTIRNIVNTVFFMLILLVSLEHIGSEPLAAIKKIITLYILQHIGTWSWILSLNNNVEEYVKEIMAMKCKLSQFHKCDN